MFRNDADRRISNSFDTLPVMVFLAILFLLRPVKAEDRIVFDNSVKPVAAGVASRDVLTLDDNNSPVEFMVALKLRDFAGLQKRIAKGELISDAEFDALYMPLDADYQAVRAWAIEQGLTIVNPDQNRMGLFLTGSATQVKQALQVSMTKVNVDGITYTSASSSPSMPANVATPVLGINGLQPHIRAKKHIRQGPNVASRASNAPPYYPSEIIKAYNGSTLTVDGTGQSIAIVIDTFPKTTDLQSFWTKAGVNQSINNISMIQVVSGKLAAPSGEETLDVEWSSSVAPGAKVRVYASLDLASNHLDQALQAVINDIPANPSIHQLSMSYGLGELDGSPAQNQTDSQYYATLASKGVTCFASSGDDGSTGGGTSLQAENPASDPSVTAVGGTSLNLNSSGAVSSETVWSGTGGGHSVQFSRPAWQTGTGVPSGNDRLVPDVALPADPSTGCLVVLNGSSQQYGGTSWSAPTWAGFCSRINQARSAASLTPVGILGAKIYPLIGTNNLRDITSGNNATSRSGGLYSAGTGYDLCTGVGVPNLANLVPTLAPTSGGGSPNLTRDPNTAVTAPTTVAVGGNLSVNSGVTNNGTAGAGAFSVTYRLSTSTTYDASGALLGNVSIGGLGATATTSVPFSGTCPNVAPGTYYLVWTIDSSSQVAENNENDNVFFDATPIAVTAAVVNQPNLTNDSSVSVTAPTSAAVGASVSLNSGVINNGSTTAGTFTVTYRLSTSTTYDASGALIGNVTINGLAASAKASVPFTGTCPNVAAGNYYLVWSIDSTNQVTESNENDNVFFDATPIAVTAATTSLPNLAPYTPQGWSNSIVVANVPGTTIDSAQLSTTDTLYVDFAYANLSSSTSTSASFVAQLFVDDTLLKTVTQPAPFGHFYVPTQDLNIGSLSAGTHTLVLKVDLNNSVSESDESDNTFTKTITVNGVASKANLTVDPNTSTVAPLTVAVGANLLVSSGVLNSGGTDSGSFIVRYRLSPDKSYSSNSDALLGDANVSSLAVGATTIAAFTGTCPNLPAGNYYLVWSIDALNQVIESNENDNIFYLSTPITVISGSTPPPNQPVILSGPTYSPNSPSIGSLIHFSVAASETGNPNLTYAWTFGDGGTGSGTAPTYTYAAAGTYSVTVTVSDSNGDSATGSVLVTVGAGSQEARVVKKSFSLNFRNGTDMFDIALFSSAFTGLTDGTQVSFQIDGQTIDSGVLRRGKAVGSFGRFTYNARSRTIEYSGRNLGLLDVLAPFGVVNQTVLTTASIPVTLGVNNSAVGGATTFRYLALAGRTGKGF